MILAIRTSPKPGINPGARKWCCSFCQHVLETIIRKHTQISTIRQRPVIQSTEGKGEPNIVFMWNLYRPKNIKTNTNITTCTIITVLLKTDDQLKRDRKHWWTSQETTKNMGNTDHTSKSGEGLKQSAREG